MLLAFFHAWDAWLMEKPEEVTRAIPRVIASVFLILIGKTTQVSSRYVRKAQLEMPRPQLDVERTPGRR
jgi:uncharacterized membrane protein